MTILQSVLDAHKPVPSMNINEEDMSSWDIIGEQRRYNVKMQQEIKQSQGLLKPETNDDPLAMIPPELERNYQDGQ